jgi:hypothetical protein
MEYLVLGQADGSDHGALGAVGVMREESSEAVRIGIP